MIFHKTDFSDVYLIDLELNDDERGAFARTFCAKELADAGINFNLVQINRSWNKKAGTIRGMHYQKEPKEEAKIVQCLRGKVLDVIIDLREGSPTLNKYYSIELSEANHQMLYIPKGFAHGFQALTDNTELEYYMSEFYSSVDSYGVRWNDPLFAINWPMSVTTISDKDNSWPLIDSI